MPFNFPDTPIDNQEFTPPGGSVTYVWKPPVWVAVAGGVAAGTPEAPTDGKQYGRQLAAWSEVVANPTWSTLAGKPATFPPTLPIAETDVTNLVNDLLGKEPGVIAGTTSQFWRGDKTFQTVPIPDWNTLANKPATFPPTLPIASSGVSGLDAKQTNQDNDIAARELAIVAGTTAQYWRGDKTFQNLTKASVGLANVDNTSDANKSISDATQTALNLKEDIANKGVANGYASLDASAKVPSAQLPAYVDDVVEYTNFAAFPATGVTGVIYVTLDTNRTYRWSGSAYVEISPSPGSTDSVPEGSVNLYYTNARASAAAPVQSVSGRTGTVVLTKTDVGLANVDNTSDANKPISTATQTALNAKEPTLTAGTTAQYYRGDKSWQTLDKTAVGLANVDNTSDANKPISSATSTALAGKAASVHTHVESDVTNLVSDLALKAPLANPTFTGVPAAPTALVGNNTTQIATTAFVTSAVSAAGGALPSDAAPIMDGAVAAGTSALYSRSDHIHPSDTSRVAKAGDTMTGDLTIAKSDPHVTLNNIGGLYSPILFQNGGVNTWDIGAGTASDPQLYIDRYNSSGVYLDSPFAIDKATGVITMPVGATTLTPPTGDSTTKVATTAFVQTAAPAGAVSMFAMSAAPTGWLKANGAAISRTTYLALFTAIGTTFGVGDGSTTFNVPDLRGEFARGWDDARGIDVSRAFGSAQANDTEPHTHTFTGAAMATHNHTASSGTESVDHTHTWSDASSTTGGESVGHTHAIGSNFLGTYNGTNQDRPATGGPSGSYRLPTTTDRSAGHTHTVAVSGTSAGRSAAHTHVITNVAISAGTPSGTNGSFGGTETRPRNIALLACIKY